MTETAPMFERAVPVFPERAASLEAFGLKFSGGGAHISRTMMLEELESLLSAVPVGSAPGDYRDAILHRNALGKMTDSTRQKSLRHLRELYALDEATPIFGLLRKLHGVHPESLAQLAMLVAWSRDPLLRATTRPILSAAEGDRVETATLAEAVHETFADQYSELNRNKIARNAASSWTQSGHLAGRSAKKRRKVRPTVIAATAALFLGHVAGARGSAIFSNPWCRLLDLDTDRARSLGFEAHRAGFLNLRALAEVVEVTFPFFAELEGEAS